MQTETFQVVSPLRSFSPSAPSFSRLTGPSPFQISERDLAIDFERQEEWNRDVTDAGLFSLKVDNASSETLDDARLKAGSSRGTSLEAGQSKQVEVKPFEEMIW